MRGNLRASTDRTRNSRAFQPAAITAGVLCEILLVIILHIGNSVGAGHKPSVDFR